MGELISQTGTHYALTRDVTTLGRESCDILLPGEEISRRHAQITRQGEQLFINDLNSTNGVYVNGARVTAPRLLQSGDQIRIGTVILTFSGQHQPKETRVMDDGFAWPSQPAAFPSQFSTQKDIPASPSGSVPAAPVPLPSQQSMGAPQPGVVPTPPFAAAQFPPQQSVSTLPSGVVPAQPSAASQFSPGAVYPPQNPYPYASPPKDKFLAFVLEFLLLGLGWIYAGETSRGLTILILWLVLGVSVGVTVNLLTGGAACLCTGPLGLAAYVISVTNLSSYMQAHPDRFR